jgi:hypothetical protein
VAALLISAAPAWAVDWIEVEAPGHRIYAPRELLPFAAEVSRQVVSLATPVAARWGYVRQRPTVWVLQDRGEWFNGAAYTLLDRIELVGQTAEFELRGHVDWVADVIAHEYSHLATLDRSRRLPRWLGGLIIGAVDDVGPTSRGKPYKGGLSFFVPPERTPRWFSEGIAQLDAELAGVDGFDSTRAMLERAAWQADSMLSLSAMASVADKTYLGGEQVYNQGYSFVRYLYERDGEAGLGRLLDAARLRTGGGFDGALAEAYGEPATQLESAWRRTVAARAEATAAALGVTDEGTVWRENGAWVRSPARSADGALLAFLDEGDADFPGGRLVLAAVSEPTDLRELADDVADFAFSRDGRTIWASRLGWSGPRGKEAWDLVRIDVASGAVSTVVAAGRTRWPAPHPDGATVAVARRGPGTWELALVAVTDGSVRDITALPWGWGVQDLVWADDGALWATLVRPGHDLDLVRWHPDDPERWQRLDRPGSHERRPRLGPDGRLWFASDGGGAWQIYSREPDGRIVRRSAAPGGALDAAPGATDVIATVYRHHRFALHRFAFAPRAAEAVTTAESAAPAAATAVAAITTPTVQTAAPADDLVTSAPPRRTDAALPTGRRARFRFGPPLIYPELQWLYGEAAAGAVAFVLDETGRHAFEAEVLLGRASEWSLAWSFAGDPASTGMEIRRFRSILKLDDGTGGELPLPYGYDSARWDVDRPIGDAWSIGATLRGDRLTATPLWPFFAGAGETGFEGPCGDVMLFCAGELAARAAWVDAAPYVRNDVDFRGRWLWLDLAGRWSRTNELVFDPINLTASAEPSVRAFPRASAQVLGARGFGPFTLEGRLEGGWIPADVGTWDEFYLGGHIFQLRRGELRTYSQLPGYGDFAIRGEKLLTTRAAVRWTPLTDLGSAGPWLFDAVVLELAGGAGNAWPHAVGWGDLLSGIGERPAGAVPYDADAGLPFAPNNHGLLYDVSLDVRLKAVLFDSVPWNSFLRLAHGFQDPTLDSGFPLRVYLGLGTGF